jgi:hypothetical protein
LHSSTRIIAANAAMGFVIEEMRKIVSRRMGGLDPMAEEPMVSTEPRLVD